MTPLVYFFLSAVIRLFSIFLIFAAFIMFNFVRRVLCLTVISMMKLPWLIPFQYHKYVKLIPRQVNSCKWWRISIFCFCLNRKPVPLLPTRLVLLLQFHQLSLCDRLFILSHFGKFPMNVKKLDFQIAQKFQWSFCWGHCGTISRCFLASKFIWRLVK